MRSIISKVIKYLFYIFAIYCLISGYMVIMVVDYEIINHPIWLRNTFIIIVMVNAIRLILKGDE